MLTKTCRAAPQILHGAGPTPAATWTRITCCITAIVPTEARRLWSQVNPVATTAASARRHRFLAFIAGSELLHRDGDGADGAAQPARWRQRRRARPPSCFDRRHVHPVHQRLHRGVHVVGAGSGILQRLAQPGYGADVTHCRW